MEKKDQHPYIVAFISWLAIGIVFSTVKLVFHGD